MIVTYRINQKRLWNTLMELAKIGASPNKKEGITRLSLSLEDLEAREYLINLMKESDLHVHVDPIGNIIGSLAGTNENAPAVIVGSHIDTVFQGGIFDGSLGVLGAIEAVRTIKESGIKLTHPIDVVSFTDEEGSRFGTGYIGSKGMTGELTEDYFTLKDDKGLSYQEAFLQANLNPTNYKDAVRNGNEMKAYIEMHIEQGKVLEENNLAVGIVTDIQGPIWLEVTLIGSADHAGATPMDMRRDASLCMAEILLEIEKIAKHYEGVGTVGKLKIEPGGVNIIPGKGTFSVDLRHVDKQIRTQMVNEVYGKIEITCKKRKIQFQIVKKKDVDPTSCSESMIAVLEDVCKELNIKTMKLPCGAGHDSLIMSKVTEMGMIFIRSKDGISHHPNEWSEKEDCATGTQVLFQSLLRLAK
ncbi:Zn-dependent hydrolase [Evansella sp. AB-P1]|uniref:Zn-dependent hydrolase n=1 Tax=Evansella sp. AB-P1 TaxID=3037653 RepID=UPI00241DFBA6|nr:Zn-dependent hydrolase [Evansella sp. AB-P1]MDG5787903.1 Zn-dependent hydrolase [Evansella sp. AB-P1]